MNTLDFNKVLREDFRYKPNFGFGAYESDGQWWIRIVMYVEDARKPLEPWVLTQPPMEEIRFDNFDLFHRRFPSNIVGYSPSRPMIEVMGNFAIPYFREGEDESFISWLVYTVKSVEQHEQDEWFRYKGELIRDPHKEVVLENASLPSG